MINRYKHTTTENKRYKSVRYRIPKPSSEDVYIFSRSGDRLDLIAQEFYQDARLWWIIAEANNLGKGTFAVPTGLQIRIPKYDQRQFEDLADAANKER